MSVQRRYRLSIDMIPQSTGRQNLHDGFLTRRQWRQLSQHVIAAAGHPCEVCDGASAYTYARGGG